MSRRAPFALAPFRPPDWRFRRASELFHCNRPASRTRDDSRTRELLAFLRARSALRGGGSLARAERRFPAVAGAMAWHEHPEAFCPLIQAHLLSDAPAVQIAASFGLGEGSIHAYHDCFFDVRDRLAWPDYIIRAVVLASRPGSAASDSAETAIKLIAYLGGPAALQQILLAPGARDGSADLIAAFADAAGTLVDALQHVALLKQPSVADAVAREGLLQVVRQRVAERSAQPNAYEKNVAAFLGSVTFRCGPPQAEDYSPKVREFMNAAVELRADQMAILMNGGELPDAAELLAKTLPLPRRPEDAGQGADAGA